ncbi:alpha/beta hydrolase [Tessaracoccus caeni]|uniref:alpha/beta hydrolase n=1 Tax=Tessaracoccus caeni TaxID=3031239 RepID=UPI0023DA98CE|nr:alpha/beta hydrolase [Tessaracoccus caeni]MDF1487875.1 alpha/beta hydrolase [Tessaracoccus caeni]
MSPVEIKTLDGSAEHEHGVVWLNVPYARPSGDPLRLQVVWPPIPDWFSDTRYPTIAFIQGSGWRWQQLGQWLVALSQFARRGYVVAIVEHRPTEIAPFPAQIEDVRAAVRFLHENAEQFRVDVDRIALWGDSSGGHLAALAAITDGTADAPGVHDVEPLGIGAVVSFYGPSDIARMPDDDACDDLLGGFDPKQHPELAASATASTYIRPATEGPLPPFLLMHGSEDPGVPFEQSAILGQALVDAGHEAELYRLEGAGHGAGAFFSGPVLDIVDDFLRKHLDV